MTMGRAYHNNTGYATTEALEERYEEQNLELSYGVLYSRDTTSFD